MKLNKIIMLGKIENGAILMIYFQIINKQLNTHIQIVNALKSYVDLRKIM